MRRKPRPGIAPGVPPQCHLHQPSAISHSSAHPGAGSSPPPCPKADCPPSGSRLASGRPSASSCPCPGPGRALAKTPHSCLPPTAPLALGHHPRCPGLPPDLFCPLTSSALSPQGWPLRLPAVAQSGHLGACCMSTLCPDVLLGFVQCGSRVGAL